ncbi:MAG: hypothetical protein P9F19_10395 [Candidatus Contendobacter sp.]|nr:hypothetical protein [Candidatus Contendobacter sp.]MDG4557781.1 hypothetical protein [Candidatus Contendobacter sp.]
MNDPRPGEWNEPDEVRDERLSELYRATRAADPPAWLDQRILAAARTAAEPRSTPSIPLPRRRGFRFWGAPVALAATVALTVGLLRWLPPVGELGGKPAALEEQALRAPAQPAAKLDAARAEIAPSARSMPAASPPSPPPVPASSAPARPSTPASRLAEPLPPSEDKAVLHDATTRRSPAAWRAEIAELRRQGRHAEAEARLAEFRRRYPHEPSNEAEPPR